MTVSRIQLRGQSMYPMIEEHEWVDVDFFSNPKKLEAFKVGQVLLVRDSHEFLLHRVLWERNHLRTKGDWAPTLDEPVMVWGKVVGLESQTHNLIQSSIMGWLSSLTQSRKNWFTRKLARLAMFLIVKYFRFLKGKR